MSTPAALATVTATLQHLLTNVLPGASVTTQPPSTARNGGSGEQLNVFLYSAHFNTAFTNAPMPVEIRNGESGFPPMPLVLKYLITAYGNNDDDISAQQLMGGAMSLFHDHPLIGPGDIVGITPDSGLQNQIERIRITPDVLSLDDMSKLWTSFQSAEYRLSTGYEVSVILIESTRTATTPLPVLKRGEGDSGPDVVAGPTQWLNGFRFPNQKPAAELGDEVTMPGENLSAEDTTVRFSHPQLSAQLSLVPEAGSSGFEMGVTLPAVADDATLVSTWPAGFYTVSLLTTLPDMPAIKSNEVSMALAPRIESINPANAPAGNVVLTIECTPQIFPEQKVRLLFGDRSIAADSIITPADPTAVTTLVFTVEDALAKPNPYVLRLRVDGVDSIPVDFSGDTPAFRDNQKVTIL